jgi:hypothetical protein
MVVNWSVGVNWSVVVIGRELVVIGRELVVIGRDWS